MQTFNSVTVIADIHGVAPALEAVLDVESAAPSEALVVLGDIAVGPQPNRVIELVRMHEDRLVAIRGNADRALYEFVDGEIDEFGEEVDRWAAEQITPENLDWLRQLPAMLDIQVSGMGRILCCHASPRNDTEILLVDTRMSRWQEAFAGLDPDVTTVLGGHTHMPFQRLVERRLVVNPGSVGMPYGRAGAHWARIANGVIESRVTHFDVERAKAQIRADCDLDGMDEWCDTYLNAAVSDVDALAAFGPLDGRDLGET